MDYQTPTAQRLRHHSGMIDAPERTQRTARLAYRLVSPVETLFRTGEISEDQWNAYCRFERDYSKSHKVHSLIAQYGARQGPSGTPASQMAADLLAPEDIRLDASRRIIRAVDAIAHPPTVGILVHLVANEATLHSAGLIFTAYSQRQAATAAAKALVQSGLYRLAAHYAGR